MNFSKLAEVAKHAFIYGIGSVLQSFLGFVLLPIMTSYLSPENYGAYSLILTASTISSAIFYFGITSALPRSYFDYPPGPGRDVVFTSAFSVLLMGSLMQILVGYLGGEVILNILFNNVRPEFLVAFKWAFMSAALSSINQLYFALLRLERHSISSVIFSGFSLTLSLGLSIFLLRDGGGEILAAPFKAVAYTQALIGIVFIYINRHKFVFQVRSKVLKPLLHFGAAAVLASFGTMLLDWSDRIIIERYLSLTDLGLYSAISRVSSTINILLILPFSQIWSPMMMEYRTRPFIKDLTAKVLTAYLFVGGGVLLFFSFFARGYLELLVHYNINQELILVSFMLMLSILLNGITTIVVAGIFYERKVYILPIIYYLMAATKIMLNLVVIPHYGLFGAASATLLSSMLLPYFTYSISKKYFSFNIEWSRLIKYSFIIFTATLYGIYHSTAKGSIIEGVFNMIFIIFTFFIIYKLCLYQSEKKYIAQIIKIYKLK